MFAVFEHAYTTTKVGINAFQVTKVEPNSGGTVVVYLADGCRAYIKGDVEKVTEKLGAFAKDA